MGKEILTVSAVQETFIAGQPYTRLFMETGEILVFPKYAEVVTYPKPASIRRKMPLL